MKIVAFNDDVGDDVGNNDDDYVDHWNKQSPVWPHRQIPFFAVFSSDDYRDEYYNDQDEKNHNDHDEDNDDLK